LTSSIIATNTGRWFGRATIAELANGNLIMAYEEASTHSDNTDDIIHLRFSDDDGATWTAEDTDLDSNAVDCGLPPGASLEDVYGPGGTYIWQASNGDVWLHCWKVDYDGDLLAGGWRTKSTDNGLTWGAWEQLTVSGQTAEEDDRTIFEETHFEVSGTVYAICRQYESAEGPSGTGGVKGVFIKSTDNGATWTKVSDIGTYANGLHEFGATYLGNNNILAIIRDQGNKYTYRITSSDLGASWNDLTMVSDAIGVIGRPRMYTDKQLKGQANWWTDTNLIMEGFILTNPGSSLGRRNAVWMSDDSGSTWTGPHWLDAADEDAGYGDIVYDSANDLYRVVTNLGTQAEADLNQYNFKVTW